jgi:DNA-binding Xre family transcriptional regulator
MEIFFKISYNNREVNILISYRPLRIYCMDNKLKLTNVIKDCDLSNSFVTKINEDKNIELKVLERICLRLGIPVQDAVVFLKDD